MGGETSEREARMEGESVRGGEQGRRGEGAASEREEKQEREKRQLQTDGRTDSLPLRGGGGTPGTLKAAAWTGHEAEHRGLTPRERPGPWADWRGRGPLPSPQLPACGQLSLLPPCRS